MVESSRGFHLVQISDIMVDVHQMSNLQMRNTDTLLSGLAKSKNKLQITKKGILGGAITQGKEQQQEQQLDGIQFKNDLTYKMETMGCQMNVADSERMEGQLQSLGIRPLLEVEEKEKATKPDVVILNTFSICDHAEQKVCLYIGSFAKQKEKGEDVTIVVAGCVAQQEGEALVGQST